ncbi:MAG: hypothetical protein ACFFER_11795 [Candidatus Thorarchaeota archaeon]
MVVNKYELPNGNVYFFLGQEEDGIENVIQLKGGNVLFLKAVNVLELWRDEILEDIIAMPLDAFAEKYEIPCKMSLLKDLKAGVLKGDYPPYRKGES